MIIKASARPRLLAAGIAAITLSPGGGAAAAPATAPGASVAALGERLPARLFVCDLGRIANFDPQHDQPTSDYVYDGRHAFSLLLPSVTARTTPPPDPTAPPEPVDPATRIVADPDRIAPVEAGKPFDRVVDLWPSRVEMVTQINEVASNVIVIDQIDTKAATASMFMTRANDAVTFDLKNLYFGKCRWSSPVPAGARSR